MNIAHASSGVNVVMKAVRKMKVSPYADASSIVANLNWVKSNQAVASEREAQGADVVVLVVGSSANCGAAPVYPQSADAYAAVVLSCMDDYMTLAHELGHILGANHNVEVSPENYPFPYGHGWWVKPAVVPPLSPCYHTIMSYQMACYSSSSYVLYTERLSRWANPAYIAGGVPSGHSVKANVARVWNEVAPSVAAFKGSGPNGGPVVPPPKSGTNIMGVITPAIDLMYE